MFSARLGSRLSRLGNIVVGYKGFPFDAVTLINSYLALQTPTRLNLIAPFKPQIALQNHQNQLDLTKISNQLTLKPTKNSLNLHQLSKLVKF